MWGLFAITPDARTLLIPSVSTAAGTVAMAPDGRIAAVIRPESNPRVFQVAIRELDGRLREIGPASETSPGWVAWGPRGEVAWSVPNIDVAGVAFGRQIWRWDGSGDPAPVTRGDTFDEAPQWTPGGELLYIRRVVPPTGRPRVDLVAWRAGEPPSLVVADVDGPAGTTLGFPRSDWDTWISSYRP
jgi:hypothetical protein